MRRYRVGSILGIPIELDLTFLLVVPLFAYLIGSRIETTATLLVDLLGVGVDAAALTGSVAWVVGLAAALGLFVGVVLHELGHSVVAMRYGYEIDSITLWLFGGIASLSEMPEDWRQELAIAVAGPVVSVLLGVGCYLALLAVPAGLPAVQFVVGYLAVLNVTLAVFNMLPGFPMDGGRVLRALLARSRPYARATEIAAEVGKGFAILMGLFGLLSFNFLLAGLALFVYAGAAAESQRVTLGAAFEGVTVADVMTPAEELDTVTEDTSLATLVDRMLRERHTGYPVVDGDRLAGLVTLEDARSVRDVERDAYTVGEVMARDLATVAPDADAMAAFTAMTDNGVGRLPVTDADGRLVGLVTRTDLMTALEIIRSSGRVESRRPPGRDTRSPTDPETLD
jgi:Zn-dependent protease/CBS domain-containing protein